LFLLSKMKRDIHPVSLMVGLISSLLIVFYLKQVGIAWTWFIGISVVTNMFITLLIDRFVILVNKPS